MTKNSDYYFQFTCISEQNHTLQIPGTGNNRVNAFSSCGPPGHENAVRFIRKSPERKPVKFKSRFRFK